MTNINISQMINEAEEFALPEPTPLLPESYNHHCNDYPVERLGPILSGAALAIHAKVQAPLSICCQCVLTAASLSSQHIADIVLPSGGAKPLSLFGITVAQSGERKSSADNMALAPCNQYIKNKRNEFAAKKTQYLRDYKIWESSKPKFVKNVDKNELSQYFEEEPKKPIEPFLTVDDVTIEGLMKAFGAGSPSLGLFSSEGGQFLGGYSQKAENAIHSITSLSKLWDGNPVTLLRAKNDPLYLENKRLSIHLMIQPDMAQSFLTNRQFNDQGILSRFLPVYPKSAIGTRFSRNYSPEEEEAHKNALQTYHDHIIGCLNHRDEPRKLEFTPEAASLYVSFADRMEEGMKKDGPYETIRPFANKAAENCARIAGVLTLIENPHATQIEAPTFMSAIILMEYYIHELLQMNSRFEHSPEHSQAERLREWICNKWDGGEYISLADIQQYGPHKFRRKQLLQRLIKILREHEWLIPIPDVSSSKLIKGKERTKNIYRINPSQIFSEVPLT